MKIQKDENSREKKKQYQTSFKEVNKVALLKVKALSKQTRKFIQIKKYQAFNHIKETLPISNKKK